MQTGCEISSKCSKTWLCGVMKRGNNAVVCGNTQNIDFRYEVDDIKYSEVLALSIVSSFLLILLGK